MATDDATYFPEGTFSQDNAELDVFVQNWYSKHLHSMEEPRLYPVTTAETMIYRFLCLPTFNSPFALRLEVVSGSATLIAKVTNGEGGYEAGDLQLDEQVILKDKQLQKIISAVNGADFWILESVIESCGLDGTHFVVEGVTDNRYHIVDRWCPDEGPFRNLCDQFVSACPRRIRKQIRTSIA